MYRAGAAISSKTRDAKGQGWLVSRASSTSLVRQDDDEDEDDEDGDARPRGTESPAFFADDEFSPVSTRDARFFTSSRPGSTLASRMNSQRNSRRGSRAENVLTPLGARTPLQQQHLSRRNSSSTPGDEAIADPDFVDADEELLAAAAARAATRDVDDEEVSRLAQARGFGLGGWVDKLVGIPLFEPEADDEPFHDDDDDLDRRWLEEKERDGERAAGRAGKAKSRAKGRHMARGAEGQEGKDRGDSDDNDETDTKQDVSDPEHGGEGGWQDAAYLLSLATKILL